MPSPFRYPYVIALHDTDAAQIIYSANIIRICVTAFEALLEKSGYGLAELFTRRTLDMPIVHIEADFEKPLTVGMHVEVLCRVAEWGEKSFRLAFEVVTADGARWATAGVVHVCIDPQTRKGIPIPPEFKAAVSVHA